MTPTATRSRPTTRRRGTGRTGAAGSKVAADRHQAWMELLTTSGPFLTLPVVSRVWPDGLAAVSTAKRARARALVAELLDSGGGTRDAVVPAVLRELLGWDDRLALAGDIPDAMGVPVVEHRRVVRADFAFRAAENADDSAEDEEEPDDDEDGGAVDEEPAAPAGEWRMLGLVAPWGTHPLTRRAEGGWVASPVERLAVLLRAHHVPVGLVTDGRWWALVWAPTGGTIAAAVWDAGLWSEEPATLEAFVALLESRRFLGIPDADMLPALFQESLRRQEEITEGLGRQVREAVELLVDKLNRLDRDSGRTLLAGVSDDDLYAGIVTVMMRVVFLLFAEERRLLPSDDDLYVTAYSIGRLVEQLESDSALSGEQTLEYRTGAWHRLLAVSRAIALGVAHEDLRLPAYGGSLFNPDRFPWLEGRAPADDGTLPVLGNPPAVDDATMFAILRAVQYVEIDGESRRLTFRALDVEQIGYVYEGLLELEVRTAAVTTIGYDRPAKWPNCKETCEVTLVEANDALLALGQTDPASWLAKHSKYDEKRLRNLLDQPLNDDHRAWLLGAVDGDTALVEALEPSAAVIRDNRLHQPAVWRTGDRYIAPSTRRSASGTHYTPRFLAEEVVSGALEALVYRPGPLEEADRNRWRLRPSEEILNLRVADIAVGSGAFLVAADRWLADRVVEAWTAEGRQDAARHVEQRADRILTADAEVDEVLLEARRRVADRCLYGVDINPLAVEMAKLSLWLITMDRERPFGFLDDRFICGDSLLGLAEVSQLETLHPDPTAGQRRREAGLFDFADSARDLLYEAADLRRQIVAHETLEVRDVEHKTRLLRQAQRTTAALRTAADAVVGAALTSAGKSSKVINQIFQAVAYRVEQELSAGGDFSQIETEAATRLEAGRPPDTFPRRCLHWPVVFPEVLVDSDRPGFDAILGNPPFLGGKKISGAFGTDYLDWLQRWDGNGVKGNADLAARFVLRAVRLLNEDRGQLAITATNTLVQGDTLEVGLEQAVRSERLYLRRGRSSHPWPTRGANLEIVECWGSRRRLRPQAERDLDGEAVPNLGADLQPAGRALGTKARLTENDRIAYQGSVVLGLGFTMTEAEARGYIDRDPRNVEILQPYVIGRDLNQRPDCSASRWIINFRDWDLARCEEYPLLLDRVRERVKPERDAKKAPDYRRYWWRYGRRGADLYDTIAKNSHVLAISLVGNAVMPVRVATGQVFAHKLAVFALEDFGSQAFFSSSVHFCWTARFTSTMRTDINYSPSDVVLTLPRPGITPELERLGERLDGERRALMLSRGWGLTRTYSQVHNPAVSDPDVVNLREVHALIDGAVLAAYGWSDLDPQIGHHATKIGLRWTVSREARFELLDRLLEENQRRAKASGVVLS